MEIPGLVPERSLIDFAQRHISCRVARISETYIAPRNYFRCRETTLWGNSWDFLGKFARKKATFDARHATWHAQYPSCSPGSGDVTITGDEDGAEGRSRS